MSLPLLDHPVYVISDHIFKRCLLSKCNEPLVIVSIHEDQ